jgi:hypothetical protein
MAETADDLSAPLGQETVRKPRRRTRLPFTATQALAVLMGLFLTAFLGFVLFNDNPLGGEPMARVALRPPAGAEKSIEPQQEAASGAKSAVEAAKPPAAAGQKTVTIIDGSSGARHDVVVSGVVPDKVETGPRVVTTEISAIARSMLRDVVVRGTASFGDVPGYEVAGKTGSADKPKPSGGYYEDKVIATFASVFPASDPKYVMIVTLDEGEETTGSEPRRTAGWTAVPVGAEIIRRAAPLLGLRPVLEQDGQVALTRVSN